MILQFPQATSATISDFSISSSQGHTKKGQTSGQQAATSVGE